MQQPTGGIRSLGLFLAFVAAGTSYAVFAFSTNAILSSASYVFWLLSNLLLGVWIAYFARRLRTSRYVLVSVAVFVIYSVPSIIYSHQSILQNYLTNIRTGPTLAVLFETGHVPFVDPHSSFSLQYVLVFILGLLTHGDALSVSVVVYGNYLITFAMSISLSVIIWKSFKHIGAGMLAMAFLANFSSVIQTERGFAIMFLITLMILLYSFNVRHLHWSSFIMIFIVFLLALSFSNLIALLDAFVFFLLLIVGTFFRGSSNQNLKRKFHSISALVAIVLVAKIVFDSLSWLYFLTYTSYFLSFVRGLTSLLSSGFPTERINGTLGPITGLEYPLTVLIPIYRAASTISFGLLLVISISYCAYALLKKTSKTEVERAVYGSLILLSIISIAFYFADVTSPARYGDVFGLALSNMLMPTLFLSVAFILTWLSTRKSSNFLWRMLVVFVIFITLTSMGQTMVDTSGTRLSCTEFLGSYQSIYLYASAPLNLLSFVPSFTNVWVISNAILTENIALYSKFGMLPSHLNATLVSTPSVTHNIEQPASKLDVVANYPLHQLVVSTSKHDQLYLVPFVAAISTGTFTC